MKFFSFVFSLVFYDFFVKVFFFMGLRNVIYVCNWLREVSMGFEYSNWVIEILSMKFVYLIILIFKCVFRLVMVRLYFKLDFLSNIVCIL